MKSIKRARLDRFLSAELKISRKQVKPILAAKRVSVDGLVALDTQMQINQFSVISLDGNLIQDRKPRYFMMNKPPGVVSATSDTKHKTVIDILCEQQSHLPSKDVNELHIAGRLDFNSTGIILLTNDGQWSRALSSPKNGITKRYLVTVEKPIMEEYVEVFEKGLYFAYEDLVTKPVKLKVLSDYEAELVLTEGRYHQIKRMFGHFNNRVLTIHRASLGTLMLDDQLSSGQVRELPLEEALQVLHPELNHHQINAV